MKRLLGWIGGKGGEQAVPIPAPAPGISMDRVGEFVRYFPIGTRVHYHPEYQRSIKLDSLILGYVVNGHTVYSDHAVQLQPGAGPAALVLHTGSGVQRVGRVDQFHFLIPFRSRSELDYPSKPAAGVGDALTEKSVNDFKRGNTVTLFNKGANGKVPYLDARVARVVDLREGFYANRRVVFLEPDPETFQFLDQRQYHRIYTQIPATLRADLEGPGYPCVVQDFSERFLRIAWDETVTWLAQSREGMRVYLSIPVRERPEPFLLQGTLHRRGEAYAVVALSRILKHKRFHDLDLIDELDLKTTLLHQPETQHALQEAPAPP